ncbi:hypothetical protein [Peribacillus frigoritolerans]|uniref:hypothetical protein n=1 Tax=Peribacillus frigoritolerans TaxID=450367 RepID=UPI00227F7CA3|nr:hypothetical protein [Peribacillus frigoritolerans]MCY8935671.1 hypothetical protein [Peribacillus frigoritolerans]
MNFNFYRLLTNKKSLFIILLIVFYPIIDLILLNYQWKEKFIPNQSVFLVGNSEGHMMQILFLWFLPIYLLIMVCENYIQDLSSGENNILILKLGKKKYFGSYLLFSFISSFSVTFLSLFFNFILSFIINMDGLQNPSAHISQKLLDLKPLLAFQLHHPTMTNLTFILISSFLVGILAVTITSICFIFPSRKYAYFLSFALWYLLIMGNKSILLIFQPFTEYSFSHLLHIFLQTIILFSCIICTSYVYKVKTDEI